MSQLSIVEDMYQRHVDRDDMGYRAARRDDYEERLDREYLGRDNYHGQPPRQRDVRLTMRGVPKPILQLGRDDHYRQPAIRRDGRRTLREMSAPIIIESPLCIILNRNAENIEINGEVIHHLPKFGGMPDENPFMHLKEFHGVCMSMKSAMDSEDNYKLRAFPFSLVSQAKSWLMSLPSGSIFSWEQLQRKFMEKYFSQFKAAEITKESSSHLGEAHGSAPVANINGQIGLEEVQELSKMVTQLMTQNTQLMELNMQQARTISELREQLSQTASAASEMQDAKEKLPLQAIQPSRSNVNAVMVKDEEHLDEDSMELNEESTSVEITQALSIGARTAKELSEIQETSANENIETCAVYPDSMDMSNSEADKELWELFSKVEALLGEKVIVESVSASIQREMLIKCKDRSTLFIEAEDEVVNSSIHVSIQSPSNNAGDHSLLTVDELKPLPEPAKTKNVGKRRRSPRKKSSKAREVQYKENYYYKRNVGKAPTKIIFGKIYNLPVKVNQKSFWIAKSCNFTLTDVGLEKELRLAQLRELRQRDKESHQDYLARAKAYYKKLGVITWSVKPGKPVINS